MNEKASKVYHQEDAHEPLHQTTRRSFLKFAGFVGANAALGTLFSDKRALAINKSSEPIRETPSKEKIVTFGEFSVIIDQEGVPTAYFIGDVSNRVEFNDKEKYNFKKFREYAIEENNTLLPGFVCRASSSREEPSYVATNQEGYSQAGLERPNDLLEKDELRLRGVEVINPDDSHIQLLIKRSAFEPAGVLYPIALLKKLFPEITDPLITILVDAGIILAKDTFTPAQNQAWESITESQGSLAYITLSRNMMAMDDFRNFLKQKIQDSQINTFLKEFEILCLDNLNDEEMLAHYAQQSKDFGLGFSRGITTHSLTPQFQEMVAVALGLPPPIFDIYSFGFNPKGKIMLFKKTIDHHLEDTQMEEMLRNLRTSPTPPSVRPFLDGYDDIPDDYSSYVVSLRDMGYIVQHEITHVIQAALMKLIQQEQLREGENGILEVIEGSTLEKLLQEESPEQKPYFLSIPYPIDNERKTDEETKRRMDEAWRRWEENEDDSGFPFVLRLPRTDTDPVRYKHTFSPVSEVV